MILSKNIMLNGNNNYGTLQNESRLSEDFTGASTHTLPQLDKLYDRQRVQNKGFYKKCTDDVCSLNLCQWILNLFPIITWIQEYDFINDLQGDVLAGITLAALQVPQGMAYSVLAGVPAITGLYMAFFPVLIYILMGTSRHTSMGTFSIVCMMTGQIVAKHADPFYLNAKSIPIPISSNTTTNMTAVESLIGTGLTPIQVGAATSFTVGIIHIVFGFSRLGVFSALMSDPMVKGFTTGTAYLVIASQLKHFFGIPLPRHSGLFRVIYIFKDIIINIDSTNWVAFSMTSITAFILFFFGEFVKPRIPKYLGLLPMEAVLVGVGIATSYYLRLNENFNISIVGPVPTGLPVPEVPPIWLFTSIVGDCVTIAVISFTIQMSMAQILAQENNYSICPNQELIACGFSNVFGSFFSSIPICSSLSRSLIQVQSGGKTQLTSAVQCFLLFWVILYMGPLFEHLPQCVLTGIVIVAMKGMLMQTKGFLTFWKESKEEGLVWIVTFLSVIFLDIGYGLFLGVSTSLLFVVLKILQVRVRVLGKLVPANIYEEKECYKSALSIPGIIIIRVTASLNFLNWRIANRKINAVIDENNRLSTAKTVIIDMMSISSLDNSIIKMFLELNRTLKKKNIVLKLAHFSGAVRNSFENSVFFKDFSHDLIFPTINDAVLDSPPITTIDSLSHLSIISTTKPNHTSQNECDLHIDLEDSSKL